jgi:hypothetical protein
MTSENTTIDALKFKIVVRQSCLNFGAVETAKKLQDSPEKLQVLLDLMIAEELVESAYLLGKKFLSEEDFATFSEREEFADVDPETVKVSLITGSLHEKLTGEPIQDTRKRLRQERRDAAKAKKAALRAERAAKAEKAVKAKPSAKEGRRAAEPKRKREAPTHTKEGLEFLTLSEFGFKRENYYFVPTIRSFFKIKDHFLEQKVIGFDAEYHLGWISTITLASENMVAVLDMISLRKNKEVNEYLKTILLSEDIEKVTHTFRTDAYYLSQNLDIDPLKIAKVLDLTEIVKEEGSDNRIGLKTMVENQFNKAINQYYKKSKWGNRPIQQEMIDYAALNGFIVLKIFLDYDEKNSEEGQKYYAYEAPKNIIDFTKQREAEAKKKSALKKSQKGGKGRDARNKNANRRPKATRNAKKTLRGGKRTSTTPVENADSSNSDSKGKASRRGGRKA